jgi:hypothetical protein
MIINSLIFVLNPLCSLTEFALLVSRIHETEFPHAKFFVSLISQSSYLLFDHGSNLLKIVGLTNNQIYGVSRRMLDVRRPREKPSKEAQEEQLIPYGPIPDERKMFASYSLEVMKCWYKLIDNHIIVAQRFHYLRITDSGHELYYHSSSLT